jgi:ADP-heptose:LPS heptosyltransferase
VRKAIFVGYNALGDTLCTTPVVRAFRQANPGVCIVYVVHNAAYCRVLDANPSIDLVLYNDALGQHGLSQCTVEWARTLPLELRERTWLYRFDIQQVAQREGAFNEHISLGFSKLLNIPIDSVKPDLFLTEADRRVADLFDRGRAVMFSMHSRANPPRPDGRGGAKDWPLERWSALAELVYAWGYDVIAVGAEQDLRPAIPHVRHLYGLPIRVVAALIERSACLVTLENGIAHMAAALDAPMVELYSNIVPLAWANPVASTRAHVLYGDVHDVSVERVGARVADVAAGTEAALRGVRGGVEACA